MKANDLISMSDFAKFARVSRDALCHYDRIGLLPPISRGNNSYRYYSVGQLAVVNLIRTLRTLGLSLAEIKILKEQRTPEQLNGLLLNQIDNIDKEIDRWIGSRKLLSTLQRSISPVLNLDESAVSIQFMPSEAIILGDRNDYRGKNDDYDALLNFYRTINGRYPHLDLNYPVWAIFSEERIRQRDWNFPDRYYFYNPAGGDERPAGLYAIGYARGGYGQNDELYERLLAYIDKNGFEICGNTYEEYPLNEICVADDTNYLLRIMIAVREK